MGLAERNVRRMKDMVSCLRSAGTEDSYHRMLCYISQTHNHFGVGSTTGISSGLENRRTPIELLLQKDRPKPVTSLFGSICMAKGPESLVDQIPEKSRFIPAACMYIKPNSLAHVVTTQISGKEHTIQAEVKPLDRLMWDTCLSIDSQGNPEDIKLRAAFERIYGAANGHWMIRSGPVKHFRRLVRPVRGFNNAVQLLIAQLAVHPVDMVVNTLLLAVDVIGTG